MAESDNAPSMSSTLEGAETAMHRGRAGSLVFVLLLGAAAIAGLVFLVSGDDQARVYGEIGKKVNGLERAAWTQIEKRGRDGAKHVARAIGLAEEAVEHVLGSLAQKRVLLRDGGAGEWLSLRALLAG